MYARFALVAVALLAAACTVDEREWMKVTQSYTTAEFQRDHKECSRKGDLSEPCMRERGWVPVNPVKEGDGKPISMDPLQNRGGGRGRY